MGLFANVFKRQPPPPPLISVGPIPIKTGDQTQDEIHRPWRLAHSIVGDNGCVSLLGRPDDTVKWTNAEAMCRYYGLRMCPQYEHTPPYPVFAPWWISRIETLYPDAAPLGDGMSSACYDMPPTNSVEHVARVQARDFALRTRGHVAFSVYPQLSGLHDISAVKRYLAPLVVACRRFPGTKWISELGVNVTWSPFASEMYGREFQRQVVEYVVNIPGLAGVNYTICIDSPGYAAVNADRGGEFWNRIGLFDIDGNERPAADVMRKAAGR